MEGRDPRSGRWIRPPGADGGRGGGIDLTFSAPKSVSVAWALADGWQREQIEQAHVIAVERSIEYLRSEIPAVRRRRGGPVLEEPAKDLVAAAYRHTTARGVSGADAPDPQLHSHVVITAAIRDDDRVVAVASRPIFRRKRELGAFYRSALAQELQQIGLAIRSRTGQRRPLLRDRGRPPDRDRGVLATLQGGSEGGGAVPHPLRPRRRYRANCAISSSRTARRSS